MFKTVVFATDGSGGAQAAMPVAVDIAKRYGAKLVIAHVEQEIAGKGGIVPLHVNENELVADLRKQAEELSTAGLEASVATSVIVLGTLAHAIEEIADKAGADLIVVGTRGHSAVAGLLLGSVTHGLLHVAARPVLAVPRSE